MKKLGRSHPDTVSSRIKLEIVRQKKVRAHLGGRVGKRNIYPTARSPGTTEKTKSKQLPVKVVRHRKNAMNKTGARLPRETAGLARGDGDWCKTRIAMSFVGVDVPFPFGTLWPKKRVLVVASVHHGRR